jgi:hypothetical protein
MIITNFRPEDMPGYQKKAKKAAPKPSTAETEAAQTVETDSKPAASRTSRKTAKSAQKPSNTEA